MATGSESSYNVGRTLQRLRKGRDWTLAAVSERTGVAVSTLSKIENNQSSPSYDVLMRLAEGLDMGLFELLKGESFSTFASGARAITRSGTGVPYESPLGNNLALSGELAKKALQPSLLRLAAGKQKPDALSRHGGEEFIYVLHGSIRFFMDPYSPVVLEEGDSAHFDSLMPHGFVAVGEEDAVILAVSVFNEEVTRKMIAFDEKAGASARTDGQG